MSPVEKNYETCSHSSCFCEFLAESTLVECVGVVVTNAVSLCVGGVGLPSGEGMGTAAARPIWGIGSR